QWYLVDIRSHQKWNKKEVELSAQCRWKELNDHFEAALKSGRPMLRLFHWLNLPGRLEARYALSLSGQGRDVEALVWADRGVRKNAGRRGLSEPFSVHAHILRKLGRYAEAQDAILKGRAAEPGSEWADLEEALIALYRGDAEAALSLAKRVRDGPRINGCRL